MSEMVARIAKAIAAELGRQDSASGPWVLGDDLKVEHQNNVDLAAVARAVLAAMREPTGAMMHEGSYATTILPDECDHFEQSIGLVAAAEAWSAMIDAALNDRSVAA